MNVNDLTIRNTPPFFLEGEEVTLTQEWSAMPGKVGDKFIVASCISDSLYVAMKNSQYYPLECLKKANGQTILD